MISNLSPMFYNKIYQHLKVNAVRPIYNLSVSLQSHYHKQVIDVQHYLLMVVVHDQLLRLVLWNSPFPLHIIV